MKILCVSMAERLTRRAYHRAYGPVRRARDKRWREFEKQYQWSQEPVPSEEYREWERQRAIVEMGGPDARLASTWPGFEHAMRMYGKCGVWVPR